MKELFQILQSRCEQGEDTVLVTIVESHGSIPRSSGAYMAVGKDGRLYGTVGGGKLEYECIRQGQRQLDSGENRLEEYNLSSDKAARLGMVCGGCVTVLFLHLAAGNYQVREIITDVLRHESEGRSYWVLFPLREGNIQLLTERDSSVTQEIISSEDGNPYYAEKFGYDGTVYLFGGGHLAQETVPVLDHLGFTCVVLEDREEFLDAEKFPQAKKLMLVDFKRIEASIQVLQEDYLCIMTRGHLCDMDAERFALRTPAGYIGVVGSRRKTQFVRGQLRKEGFTDGELDRIVTPIGLEIQAQTPAEIAISIAAQLIQVRAEKWRKRK